ncbi:MAG: hypothetical protein JAY71_18765 [Candidatus Thiodiazotropha weberae]|nr:hypothetical protein [Candidatus Thiodiazotropha weberae]
MNIADEVGLLNQWLRGDSDAIDLAMAWVRISQTWDDLIDGDKPVSPLDINRMMVAALVDIPKNRFFQQHCHEILPVVEQCVGTWLSANSLECRWQGVQNTPEQDRFRESDLMVSYIIRSVVTDLVIHLAGIIGGMKWREQAGVEIRRKVYQDNESFREYCEELSRLHKIA